MYSIKSIISIMLLALVLASCSKEEDATPRVNDEPSGDVQGVINDQISGTSVVIFSDEKQGIFSVFETPHGAINVFVSLIVVWIDCFFSICGHSHGILTQLGVGTLMNLRHITLCYRG